MKCDLQVGDQACLKEPVKGYRYVEITGFDDNRVVVKTTSGYEFTVYEDELERD